MIRRPAIFLSAFFFTLSLAAADMTLRVDASEAWRGVFHAHVVLPAHEGANSFVYPEWIPGEHTASGSITQLVGLHVHAGERELPWRRDAVDMFTFHVDAPSGTQQLEIDFDYLNPASTFSPGGYGESSNATPNLLAIEWNQVVVAPAKTASDDLTVRTTLRLPAGWKYDTALPVATRTDDTIEFAPVTLTTLVDSPLMAGKFTRNVPIADAGREHLFIVADSSQALALPDARISQLGNLVAETDALFGARHYRTYTWLVALSDLVMTQGLEHHESSDNRAPERGYVDPTNASRYIHTLSHEFVHSWNGKYRRPAGLATPDFQTPMQGELLWVYEGMTRYLGDFLLTARSGLRTPEEDREFAAFIVANLDNNRPGRNWRPLVDTAVGVSSLVVAPGEGAGYRRSLDYYDEMLPVWLDVDTTIRTKSGGKKSLDDFCRAFFGPPAVGANETPHVKPYTFDDVVATLNSVVPNDWASFLRERVYQVQPHPPVAALEAAGWRLIYNDKPNTYFSLREKTNKNIDLSFAIGAYLKSDGSVSDVVYGSPAFQAGLLPGMHVTSINGRKFSDDVVHEEVQAAKSSKTPMQLGVEIGSSAMTLSVDYHGGERYPHLERIEGKADLLSEILKSKRAR